MVQTMNMLSLKFVVFVSFLLISEISGLRVPEKNNEDKDFEREDGYQVSDRDTSIVKRGGDGRRFGCGFEKDECGLKLNLGSIPWKRGTVKEIKPYYDGGKSYLYAKAENSDGKAILELPMYYGDDQGRQCFYMHITGRTPNAKYYKTTVLLKVLDDDMKYVDRKITHSWKSYGTYTVKSVAKKPPFFSQEIKFSYKPEVDDSLIKCCRI